MENNNQINLKFGKEVMFRLYIPRDIYETLINLYKSQLKYSNHLKSLIIMVTNKY